MSNSILQLVFLIVAGSRCENCINLTCQNGGICNHAGDVEHCNCPSGYSGLRCERSDCENYCGMVRILNIFLLSDLQAKSKWSDATVVAVYVCWFFCMVHHIRFRSENS